METQGGLPFPTDTETRCLLVIGNRSGRWKGRQTSVNSDTEMEIRREDEGTSAPVVPSPEGRTTTPVHELRPGREAPTPMFVSKWRSTVLGPRVPSPSTFPVRVEVPSRGVGLRGRRFLTRPCRTSDTPCVVGTKTYRRLDTQTDKREIPLGHLDYCFRAEKDDVNYGATGFFSKSVHRLHCSSTGGTRYTPCTLNCRRTRYTDGPTVMLS